MSRYVDVDAVKNIIRSGVSTDTEADQEYVCERIDEAPSIDIVRCRECRYWHSGECWGIPYRGDYDTSIDTKADDFCSYGEREGE